MAQPKCGWCAKEHDPNIMCASRREAYQRGLTWGINRIKAWRLLKKMATAGLSQ